MDDMTLQTARDDAGERRERIRAWRAERNAPLVVLDDDPTGSQSVHHVDVVTDLDRAELAAAVGAAGSVGAGGTTGASTSGAESPAGLVGASASAPPDGMANSSDGVAASSAALEGSSATAVSSSRGALRSGCSLAVIVLSDLGRRWSLNGGPPSPHCVPEAGRITTAECATKHSTRARGRGSFCSCYSAPV